MRELRLGLTKNPGYMQAKKKEYKQRDYAYLRRGFKSKDSVYRLWSKLPTLRYGFPPS
jgi:hypothetical protein